MASPYDVSIKPAPRGWKAWSRRTKILISAGVLLIVAAIAIALGIGLSIGLDNQSGTKHTPPTPTPTGPYNGWKPEVGTTWQIEILYPLNDTSFAADMYDIDAFINDASTIANLQSMGRKVICYFSAGTYEDWRPDKDEFKPSDLGNSLADWPGEKWIDTNSQNVRDIMSARLDMAKSKGCDGVDPDNVDAYANNNGLGLTKGDAIDYVNWLADQSHWRGMAVGLKNAGGIIDSVIDGMQWSVNEQCAQFRECTIYEPFIQAGKPVFHIEYPKGQKSNDNPVTSQELDEACNFPDSDDFSTIIKNMDLDYWIETCS